MFAIVDIETTGGSPRKEKITEIAIFIHDGLKIVDEFSTLINPECTIPYFITGLTGITNEMVADAPKFYEVAKEIVQITEGQIFVGHNVNFDYSFVRQEFKNLGFEYNRKTLDTVRYARHVIPGLKSYSLGRLCKQLSIPITNRHRAAGDALATTKLLELLLSQDQKKIAAKILKVGNPQGFNDKLTKSKLNKLPEEPGVYYLWDEKGELIYIGKSINIKSRILQHLHNNGTQKAMDMRDRAADITWDLTGNELSALILESYKIKKHKPVYNRAQRRSIYTAGLLAKADKNGYIRLAVGPADTTENLITTFSTKREGKESLLRWAEEYQLCQKLCGLYDHAGACFQHGIGECKGACIGKEVPEEYNLRVQEVINKFEYDYHNFFIILPGRIDDEVAVVQIVNGKFQGMGYAPSDHQRNQDLLQDAIKCYPDNRDIHTIIKSYIRRHDVIIIEN
jgi:DNA polymerase-3 subunit epsilon